MRRHHRTLDHSGRSRGLSGKGRSLAALDGLNFFLADVQSGLGPFLGIYLLTEPGWNAESIGAILTISGVASLVVQTPAGALIDRTRHKRALVIAAAVLVSVGAAVVTVTPSFPVVTAAQVVIGVAGAIFPPALAAIALGLVGPRGYAYRTGRMQAFNHAGNVIGAAVAGIAGYLITIRAGFWLTSILGIFVVLATLAINGRLIDHDLARGWQPQHAEKDKPSGFAVLLRCRPLLLLAVSVLLFHLANAAMLPIMGQKLALRNSGEGTLFQAALIIVAQLVMIPMAILVGRRADVWGRKTIFLAAFLALPLRGVLFTLSNNSAYLVGVQVLDGVGAGIFGAVFPVMVADLTRGTGRYNVAFGAATTMQGIGAALSTTLAGAVIVFGGYDLAFFTLAGIALVALLLFSCAVPETSPAKLIVSGEPQPVTQPETG
ncbi:MAG: MFS transporter [Pseudonocardiales bacterium]|nr:MFS transporter [Pseudonocardiales bacterium]